MGLCNVHYQRLRRTGQFEFVGAGQNALKHGYSPKGIRTPTYQTWVAMKVRCNNPKHPFYKHYGGRGITYDPRWDDFAVFLADMGERPDGKSLDRIDNDGNYELTNCRWATQSEQAKNRRSKGTINALRPASEIQ